MPTSSQRPGASAAAGDGDGEERSDSFPELLSFAARAQALISELLIVSEGVPAEFRDPRFDPVLFDLRYFDLPDDFESRINGNRELQTIEDELREGCAAYLQNFFHLTTSIVTYHEELFKYLADLQVKELLHELDMVISDGILTRNYVFENSHHLLSLVRACNVLMHWLLLHKYSIDKKLRNTITSTLTAHQIGDEMLLSLFLKTCQLEFEMKRLYLEILEGRDSLWDESKHCALDRMKEISQFFCGSWASSYKMKNESLEVWFGKLVLEVHSLDYLRAENSGRKIYQIISSLKEVEHLHQVEENPHLGRSLSEVQRYLKDMLKALSVDNDAMSTFTMITTSIYAWSSFEKFIALLKKKIEEDASTVLILHCFFNKFSPLLDIPMSRIAQEKSSYLLNMPSYYTLEYVSHVRTMLNILPVMIFRIFSEDISKDLQPFQLSNRIDIANLQDFIQLDSNYDLNAALNKTSILSQAIILMSTYVLDGIELDLKNLLESQISNELSRQLEYNFKALSMSIIGEREDLEMRMTKLFTYVLTQQHVMECLQDLLHIRGNYIWGEVFADFLKHSSQQEADGFLRRSQGSMLTQKQLNDLSGSQTFFGRLMCQMLYLSSPSSSMFIEPMSGWFDSVGHELIGLHFFGQLESCVGAGGMAILDSLIYCAIKVNLENVFMGLRTLLDMKILEELFKLDVAFCPAVSLPLLGCSPYKQMFKTFNLSCEPWVESLATVGQLQLLRYMISLKLNSLREVQHGQGTHSGLCFSFKTIYMGKDSPNFLSRYMSIITISQLSHYVFDPRLGTLTCQVKRAVLDSSPVMIGLGTFLGQFHPKCMVEYIQYMGQYVRAVAKSVTSATGPQKGAIDPASEASIRLSDELICTFEPRPVVNGTAFLHHSVSTLAAAALRFTPGLVSLQERGVCRDPCGERNSISSPAQCL